MTEVNSTDFKTQTETLYADNSIGQIGAGDLRTQMDDIADSVPFKKTGFTTAPTVNDDGFDTAGNGEFQVGDFWVDETANKVYVCVDNSTGVAIWIEVTSIDVGNLSPTAAPAAQEISVWVDGNTLRGFTNFKWDEAVDELKVEGDIVFVGANRTIDGRDVSVDGTKLDGIPSAAIENITFADDPVDGGGGSSFTAIKFRVATDDGLEISQDAGEALLELRNNDITADTANRTLGPLDNFSFITNEGAAGTVTWTLPLTSALYSSPRLVTTFFKVASQTMRIIGANTVTINGNTETGGNESLITICPTLYDTFAVVVYSGTTNTYFVYQGTDITKTDVIIDYDTVALLVASTEASRGVGTFWEAGGFRYIEVASSGHIQNAASSPVQLDVLAGAVGFDVTAFDAKGDGTTDDTTAIQAAIDAVFDADGGAVYLSAGTYNHTGLTMRAGVRFSGESRHNTILQYTPATGDAITGGADLNRVGFENIKFHSNNSSNGWAIFFDLATVRQFRIVNCSITGFLKGMKIDDAMQAVIDQLYVGGQGKTEAGGIGVQLGHSASESGTTWSVNSLFVTIFETAIVVWAGQCSFDNIIVENAVTAVDVRSANVWNNIWSAANTTFWKITGNGQFIQGFREGEASTDYLFAGNAEETRTTIIPRTADLSASASKANHLLFPLRTYSDGKILIHDSSSTDTSGTIAPHSNFTGALNLWSDSNPGIEAELKISVPRQTQAQIGKNLYLQAGGAKSGEANNDSGTLHLMAGTATGSGEGDVRVSTVGGGSSGSQDEVATERWIFKNSGELYPATDGLYDLGRSAARLNDIYATNSTIQTSDRQEKDEIEDEALGLDFILKLKPKSFKFKAGKSGRIHHGLIAQDFKDTLDELGIDHAAYIETALLDPETDEPLNKTSYGLRYQELIGHLIKAIQELKTELDGLTGN
jgi:hypothetical protein